MDVVTIESIKTAYPDVHKAIYDEAFKAGLDQGKVEGIALGKTEGKAEGATAERERISGIKKIAGLSALSPDVAKAIEAAIEDGQTTPEQAAVKILEAHNAALAKKNESFRTDPDASKQIPAGGAPDAEEGQPKFDDLVKARMDEKKCSRAQAIKEVATEKPETHKAYLAALNKKEVE